MPRKTLLLIAAAVAVGGITFLWWRRAHGQSLFPQLSVGGGTGMTRNDAIRILATATPSLPVPKALRTPEQQRVAEAAELLANTGPSHF